MSTTLNCRLLCASRVAEDILPGESFNPNPCYYDPIRYHQMPVPIVGGPDAIDAATVGTNDDGVIVAFRGTLVPALNLPSILDWLQDFLVIPTSAPGLPGMVHSGFLDAIKAIWTPLLAEIKRQMTGGAPLIITGHSKGAGMAPIAAYMLYNEGIVADKVIPFASPNPGNAEFATGFNAIFSETRYINHLDIVPFVPPTPALVETFEDLPEIGWLFKAVADWNYSPVGKGIYIASDGTNYDEASNPDGYLDAINNDLKEIGEAILENGGLASIAKAHTLMCGHGYMKGVCQDSVCGSAACS